MHCLLCSYNSQTSDRAVATNGNGSPATNKLRSHGHDGPSVTVSLILAVLATPILSRTYFSSSENIFLFLYFGFYNALKLIHWIEFHQVLMSITYLSLFLTNQHFNYKFFSSVKTLTLESFLSYDNRNLK